MTWLCTALAVCFFINNCAQQASLHPHLRCVIEFKARGALNIVIPSVSQRVVGADHDLQSLCQRFFLLNFSGSMLLTGSLLPGSFTVVNCSSLYFSKAGPSCSTSWGSDKVSCLISNRSFVNWVVRYRVYEGSSTGNNIVELLNVSWFRLFRSFKVARTSPGGAPSTKADTASTFDMVSVPAKSPAKK